jgi:hypothetical protein
MRLSDLARRPLGTVYPDPRVAFEYVSLPRNVAGRVSRPGVQVAPGLLSTARSYFGLAEVQYDVTRMTMSIDSRLFGTAAVSEVVAHENYHVVFPLFHPRIAYIGDRGLPVMRVYARYAEELGAYYAGNTPLLSIPRMAYRSTVGAYARTGAYEFMAPPLLATMMGGAGAGFTGGLAMGAGAYQLGQWYFTPPPYVLPPLTPKQP